MAKIKQPHIRMRLPLAEQEGFVRSVSDGIEIVTALAVNLVTLFQLFPTRYNLIARCLNDGVLQSLTLLGKNKSLLP